MTQLDKHDLKLDSSNPIPLHMQFRQRILDKVRSGQWKAGERIPSERELMLLAGISRATVRQAITALVQQGLLEKIHGRGTFVKYPKFEQPLQIVYSFYEQLRSMGAELQDQVLKCEVIEALPELAGRLRINPGDAVIHLMRLRFLKNTPMMVSIAHIPYRLCPELIYEKFNRSLYRLLVDKYHLPVLRAVDRMEAVAADNTMASYLQISIRTPLMYVERIAFTTNGAVLHLGYNYIRGDMCSFSSQLHASPTSLLLKSAAPNSDEQPELWNTTSILS